MRKSKSLRGVLVGICALVLLACGAAAQNEVPYQSESGSWSFIKPDGWNPIAFAVMREVEARNREDYPDKNYKYVAGFTRGGMNTFNYPYIFVNVTDADLSGLSYSDLERGLTITKPRSNREKLLRAAVRQFAWGDTTVDSDRNRTVSIVHLPPRNKFSGGPVTLTVYSYLGSHNIIQFECFDLDANGTKNAAYVEQIIGSFKYSEGNAFISTAGLAAGPGDGLSRMGAIVILSILGGLVVLGVMLALIAKALKKT